MAVKVLNQDSVLDHARDIIGAAGHRVWITSPWIRQEPTSLLLRDALPRVRAGELDVRIVYRLKEAQDLEITQLAALTALENAGCQVRFSNRLHAKLILTDIAAIVSSSNLTATAGYGADPTVLTRNEELGVLVHDDDPALTDLQAQFEAIWSAASRVDERTIGIAMDFPTVRAFSFAAIRDVHQGEYATAVDAAGNVALGRITEVTAYNQSFPRMDESVWITQGYPGAGGGGRVEVPDLQSLFSYPAKERGFLVAKAVVQPESMFHIARVEVLKRYRGGRLVAPTMPVAPGSDVSHAPADLLAQLLGRGDIRLGAMQHHPDVAVALRSDEVLSTHLAVLGMTGSGKSNAIKVLLRELLGGPLSGRVRVVVIDTHGEYAAVAGAVTTDVHTIDVELRRSVLDDDVVKQLARLARMESSFVHTLCWIAADLSADEGLDEFLAAVEAQAGGDQKFIRYVAGARAADDVCLWPEECATIVDAESGAVEDFTDPGLYLLNLRDTADREQRAQKAAAVMDAVFQRGKRFDDDVPTLVVLEEAQNFVPEQQTGLLARLRLSFNAAYTIASEGRKFGVGLVVSSQRPARVNKDILSQCNTHLIFRMANAEDLQAIGGSFEAASEQLLGELPGFDTGVCVVGGTAIDMVARVAVPLFDAVAGD